MNSCANVKFLAQCLAQSNHTHYLKKDKRLINKSEGRKLINKSRAGSLEEVCGVERSGVGDQIDQTLANLIKGKPYPDKYYSK